VRPTELELIPTPYEEPERAYRRGVEDLLRIAKDAERALFIGARRPHGTGMNTVRSFVAYLTEQAEKLKGKT
jgi:hypothetical protein